MRKVLLMSALAVLAVLFTTLFPAHGAAPAQASVADVEALREQILRLEARVAALEQSRAVPPQVGPQLRPGGPIVDPDGYGNIQFQLVPTGRKDH